MRGSRLFSGYLEPGLLTSGMGNFDDRVWVWGIYLIPVNLRLVFQRPFWEAVELLEEWLGMAWSSGIDAFERLGDTIANHIDQIPITLEHRLFNALVEAVRTRIRLLTRRAFGFHSSRPPIALAMLSFGGYRLVLPGPRGVTHRCVRRAEDSGVGYDRINVAATGIFRQLCHANAQIRTTEHGGQPATLNLAARDRDNSLFRKLLDIEPHMAHEQP